MHSIICSIRSVANRGESLRVARIFGSKSLSWMFWVLWSALRSEISNNYVAHNYQSGCNSRTSDWASLASLALWHQKQYLAIGVRHDLTLADLDLVNKGDYEEIAVKQIWCYLELGLAMFATRCYPYCLHCLVLPTIALYQYRCEPLMWGSGVSTSENLRWRPGRTKW